MKTLDKYSKLPFGISKVKDVFIFYVLKFRIPLVYQNYNVCTRKIDWGSPIVMIGFSSGEIIVRYGWSPIEF